MGFVTLYTALSGIQAAQAAVDTASQNVSNAGTEGYSRRRVDLATRPQYRSPIGILGTGVKVDGITRSRSSLLDSRVRESTSSAQQYTTLGGLLADLERIAAEPDAGINVALGDVWTSFENLALDPPNRAARLGVIGAIDSLAARVRSIATDWSESAKSAEARLATKVDETNALLRRIATLNVQIVDIGRLGAPNDMLDERDRLIDQVAGLIGVNVIENEFGSTRLSINGLALVEGDTVHDLTFDASTSQILHDSGNALTVGGEVGGYQAFLSTDYPAQRSALDAFAADLVSALNTTHAAGFTPSGVAGGPLVTASAGDEARTISIAISTPEEIAAATDPGPPVPEFDGTNADAFVALRSATVALGGTATLDSAMRTIVTDLGATIQATQARASSLSALQYNARQARLEVTGVSLDEEMASLMQFQRTFEASARVLTAVDEMLSTLINSTGLAGR